MARNPYGNLSTIEYIGPRPQKPKKGNSFGGWVILIIALSMAYFFGKPFFNTAMAEQQVATAEAADHVIAKLNESNSVGDKFSIAAIRMSSKNSDACKNEAELIQKVYSTALGMDLKKLLSDDMSAAFEQYPQIFNENGVNAEQDITRLPNLLRYFTRNSKDIHDTELQNGDVIFWQQGNGDIHTAIIVPAASEQASSSKWLVHFRDGKLVWENAISQYNQVLGRYRYGM